MANTSSSSGIGRKKATITIENQRAPMEDVRARAYTLYESRGKEDGHDLDDWLLAERQVIETRSLHRAFRKPYSNRGHL